MIDSTHFLRGGHVSDPAAGVVQFSEETRAHEVSFDLGPPVLGL